MRRGFRRLIAAVVPSTDRGEVLSGMDELYERRRRRHGRIRADLWYGRHALGFAWRLLLGGAVNDSKGGGGIMEMAVQEIRGALRRLLREPVFGGVAAAVLAVAVASFATIFAVVDGVLLERPGYDAPDRLVWVWRDYWFPLERGWLGGPDIVSLRTHDDVFEDVVGIQLGSATLVAAESEDARSVNVMFVSVGFFDLLGVSPALGRGFTPGEDGLGGPQVAVVSHALWRSQYGTDPALVGQDIRLDGQPVRVVGIAPPDFHFVRHASLGPPAGAEVWMPLQTDLAAAGLGGSLAGLARVRPGVSEARLEAAVDAVAEEIDAEFGGRGLEMWSIALSEDLLAGVRPALLALLASALLLLAVLAVNLATLFFSRAIGRESELAVRAALGAGPSRLVAGVTAEAVVLAGIGVAAGLSLTVLGLDLVRRLAPPDLPRLWAVDLDGSVVTVSVVMALALALSASLGPGLAAARSGVAQRLRASGPRGGGARSERVRGALVVLQVALSLTLLVSAGLLGRAFARLLASDPGFDAPRAITFELSLDGTNYPDEATEVDFERRLRANLAAIPGVEAVGVTDALPLSGAANQRAVTFPGAPGNSGQEDEDSPLADYLRIGVGYAEAVGLRLRSGRTFGEVDGAGAPLVAIIDDVLAERFFPGRDPIGSPIVVQGDTARVVGVVDQARLYDVHADDRGQVYLPYAQSPHSSPHVVVRSDRAAAELLSSVRGAVRSLDPEIPLSDIRTLAERRREALGQERLTVALMSTFAVGALLLAVLGVYGVVASTVARRTREFGVRMALGADAGQVLRGVLARGVFLSVIGSALGFVFAYLLTPSLGAVVTGMAASDPLVYTVVFGTLVLVTALASLVPAMRAVRVDPVSALRGE